MPLAKTIEIEKPKPGRPKKNPWLNKDYYLRQFYIHCQPQRTTIVARIEAEDSYNKIMNDPKASDDQKAFMLESVATNSGAAQGVSNLIRNSKNFWDLYAASRT